jgi:hypothetical protein
VNRNDNAAVGRSARSARWTLCAWIAAVAIVCSPAAAWAEGASVGEKAKVAGLGAGSAILSLVYAPVKLVYASCGLVVGGMAYAFSGGDTQVANTVLTPSLLGDYVVSPKQLTGEESFEFFGRDPGYQPRSANVAVAPPPPESGWDDETW